LISPVDDIEDEGDCKDNSENAERIIMIDKKVIISYFTFFSSLASSIFYHVLNNSLFNYLPQFF